MKTLNGLTEAACLRGGFVSIGNFDGVHCGHRSMIAALIGRAREFGGPAVVFTFEPHPIALLRPEQTPPPLTTIERKLELLAECGVDYTLVYPTDQALLDLTPRAFFDQIVLTRLGARGLVEGPNFCFGHDRLGTIDTLSEFCAAAGLSLDVVPPLKAGDLLVSSTEIRRLILAGDVRGAARLLGTFFRVRGRVVHGAERGRTLGFPTANLEQVRTVLPRDGVYAGRVQIDGVWHAAAINLGPNPTFAEQARKFEVHVIDYSGDLYNTWLDVELLDRLRDTIPFPGLAALQEQLRRDVAGARQVSETGFPADTPGTA